MVIIVFNFNLNFRSVFLPLPQFLPKFQEVTDPFFDGVLLSSEDHLAYLNQKKFKTRLTSIAQESLLTLNLCLYFNQKSNLVSTVDDYLIRLTTYGFIEQWAADYIDKSYLFEPPSNPEPHKFGMHQLIGSYQILALGWTFGLFMLLLEILSTRVKLLRDLMSFLH